MPPAIAILGQGAMATVCALILESRGFAVTVWGRSAEHIDAILRTGRNDRYLPGRSLPASIRFTSDAAVAFDPRPELIVAAIPTQFIRPCFQGLAACLPADVPIVSVAKGIEADTLLRPTQILADVLDRRRPDPRPYAALSGPSIAEELARGLPATVCAASPDPDLAQRVQAAFTTPAFRVYTNPDLLGVELAGAGKNVIALAAGILDGLQAGINAKSALLARGLAEIARLGVALGAQPETFFGIAGVGDLATTCFSPQGRNRSCGEQLGRGRSLPDVLRDTPGIVEGVPTARAVVALAARHRVDMPLAQAVHQVLFHGLDPRQALGQLMTRQPKAERVG